MVFFTISTHLNKSEKHLFFTNVKELPTIDDIDVKSILSKQEVEIIYTDFKYKTPTGYYGSWRNQFYEFSILEHISNYYSDADNFLILDSDCVFTRPFNEIFTEADRNNGFLSYINEYAPEHNINGLTRLQMKSIYEELLDKKELAVPEYHAGEFFLSSGANVRKIFESFLDLWPQLIKRNTEGLIKFNEEAQTLSYLYFQNNLIGGGANKFIKRMWTNPVIYRNIENKDVELTIWHLPSEKTLGLERIYRIFKKSSFNLELIEESLLSFLKKELGIPNLGVSHYFQYYVNTYVKALSKRINKKRI